MYLNVFKNGSPFKGGGRGWFVCIHKISTKFMYILLHLLKLMIKTKTDSLQVTVIVILIRVLKS